MIYYSYKIRTFVRYSGGKMNGTMQTGTVNVVKLTKEDLQKAVNKLDVYKRQANAAHIIHIRFSCLRYYGTGAHK